MINRPSECLCLINEASLVGHKDNIISNEREKRFEVHQGIALSLIDVSIYNHFVQRNKDEMRFWSESELLMEVKRI